MFMHVPVEFDIANSQMHIGSLSVLFEPADNVYPGALRVGEPADEALIRPLTFGERYEIASRAMKTADPVEAFCQWVLHASMIESKSTETKKANSVFEVVALVLAGGSEPASPYVHSLVLLGETGWDVDQIDKASCLTIDRVLQALEPAKTEDSWVRLDFQSTASDSIDGLRRRMAENLLSRAAPPASDISNVQEPPLQSHPDSKYGARTGNLSHRSNADFPSRESRQWDEAESSRMGASGLNEDFDTETPAGDGSLRPVSEPLFRNSPWPQQNPNRHSLPKFGASPEKIKGAHPFPLQRHPAPDRNSPHDSFSSSAFALPESIKTETLFDLSQPGESQKGYESADWGIPNLKRDGSAFDLMSNSLNDSWKMQWSNDALSHASGLPAGRQMVNEVEISSRESITGPYSIDVDEIAWQLARSLHEEADLRGLDR